MQQTVMLNALATGLRLLGDLSPFVSEANTAEDAEAALEAIDQIMPTMQSIMDALDEPNGITEAEAEAIAEEMTQHVTDWLAQHEPPS